MYHRAVTSDMNSTHSHLYESMQSGAPWTVSGSNWALKRKVTGRQHTVGKKRRGGKKLKNVHARFDKCPEGKHGLEERSGAPRCISNRLVRHMHVKVAHIDHDRLAISHIRSLVPPVREPVRVRGPLDCSRSRRSAGARLEPPLQLLRLSRGAKSAHRRFATRVLGGCEVWVDRVEVLGQRGGEGRDGEVRERGLVSEHRALLWIGFVTLRLRGRAIVRVHGPRH